MIFSTVPTEIFKKLHKCQINCSCVSNNPTLIIWQNISHSRSTQRASHFILIKVGRSLIERIKYQCKPCFQAELNTDDYYFNIASLSQKHSWHFRPRPICNFLFSAFLPNWYFVHLLLDYLPSCRNHHFVCFARVSFVLVCFNPPLSPQCQKTTPLSVLLQHFTLLQPNGHEMKLFICVLKNM